jgi:hypothetical protein
MGGSDHSPKGGKPPLPFPRGSADVVATAGAVAAAPPAVSTARASASAARVASLVNCLVAGAPAPAPSITSSAASAALGEGAEGCHLSGGARPHRFPPPLPRLTTSTPRSRERKAPAARAAKTPRSFAPGALVAGGFAPSCAPPTPAPAAAPRACALGTGAWAGRTARHLRPLFAKERARSQDTTTPREPVG